MFRNYHCSLHNNPEQRSSEPNYLFFSDQKLLWLLIVLVLVVKLARTVAAYSSYLQCMELYPTCLRQTGTSVGFLVASALGALGPYIVYLVNQQSLVDRQ